VGRAAVLALAALAASCSRKDEPSGASPAATPAPAAAATTAPAPTPVTGGRVHVAITVDWEGAYLSEDGLDHLDQLRGRLPDVPLTHFVCPAYLTAPGADVPAVVRTITDSIRPADEVGLHVHGWRSLARRAGVAYRTGPSFLAAELIAFPSGDQGFEVELGAYPRAELRALVAASRRLLEEHGVEVAPLFRAGGSIAPPELLDVLAELGFAVDSSASAASWLDGELPGTRIARRWAELWPAVGPSSPPWRIDTPHGPILEVPLVPVDHATPAELADVLARALARAAAPDGGDAYLTFVVPQETAAEDAPRLARAIEAARAGAEGGRLVFETTSALAAAAGR
jgi:hypothetical protein